MEKHSSIVSYHDPTDDTSATDQILMFNNENPCLGLAEFPEIAEPSSRNPLLFPPSHGADANNILDPDDPLSDPFIWEVLNRESSEGNVAPGNCDTGPSGIKGNNNLSDFDCDMPQASSGFGNPVQLSVWPVPASPYNCSCCHVLREIIHINGQHVSNLEIHGRLGIISHGVLDRYEMDLSSRNHEYQMFDFCKESLDSVKEFLVQYCKDRRREGYTIVQDPLSIFYEVLCVGFDEKGSPDNIFIPPCSAFSGVFKTGNNKMNQQDVASHQYAENIGSRLARTNRQEIVRQHEVEESSRGSARSSLAEQRKRTGKLKLKDFSELFHFPINDAARRMNICPTVIKKICRKGGLSRWPYRKIKGVKRKISMKQESLTAATTTPEERARVVGEIQTLEQELEDIFAELSRC